MTNVKEKLPKKNILLRIRVANNKDHTGGGVAIFGEDGKWYWAYDGEKYRECEYAVTEWEYLYDDIADEEEANNNFCNILFDCKDIWEQVCKEAEYSPEKIGAYVLKNLLTGTESPAVREPDRTPADVLVQNNSDGSLPLTIDELREMNDEDVWIVCSAGADGSRLIMHALVESDQDSGNVWLTNSLGGRAIFDDLKEASAIICRKKPQVM